MPHPLSLENQTAVILGGTTGIGRALALGLAQAGADVIPTGRRPDPLEETAAQIEALGRQTLRQPTDITSRPALESLRDTVLARFGKIDILINCAGVIQRAPTLTLPEADWQRILDTNLTGTLRACQIFGAPMLDRRYGRIINISSLNAFVALNEVAAYAASKAALVSLTRSLAVEWSRHGVLVNSIAPGVFRTDLNAQLLDSTPRGHELLARTPIARFGRTEELIGAAIYLAAPTTSYTTGQTLIVDGGFLASGVNQ